MKNLMTDEQLAQVLGKVAYEYYREAIGDTSPSWEELVQDSQRQVAVSAWKVAALGVAEEMVKIIEQVQSDIHRKPNVSPSPAHPSLPNHEQQSCD